jgi:hypothetical protein
MPPEIREIVDEAGEGNCFYYSDRWRQGTKPSVGQAAREMPNTVPGSEITAEQTVDSAKPIADNRGFSFEGDDDLTVAPIPAAPSSITAALAAHEIPEDNSTNDILRTNPSTGEFRLFPRDQDAPELMTAFVEDSAGNSTAAMTPTINLTGPFVVVLTASVDRERAYVTAVGESGSDQATASGLTGASIPTRANITLGSGEGARYWKGPIFEFFFCTGADPTNAQADRLRDRMAWRHDL